MRERSKAGRGETVWSIGVKEWCLGMRLNKIICLFGIGILTLSQVYAQKYQTLGPGSCGLGQNNCHASESKQMVDKHKNSVDDLSGNDNSTKYAELSGVGEKNMLKGNSKCMVCHGTIISGKEASEVEEGVSCESCHGPGSGYKDPHSEGKEGGVNRTGYVKSLQLGLVEVKNLDTRAQACVRCHYITDQVMLASGHPDGARFNYISAMKSVAKHWKRAAGTEDLSKSSFDKAKTAKGPLPKVAAPKVTTAQVDLQQGVAARQQQRESSPVRRPPPGPRQPAPDPFVSPSSAGPVELPPFPTITDSMQVDQILLLLKKRLELLYEKVEK